MTMKQWLMGAAVLAMATPAGAGYKLMQRGVPETVRSSALVVTPTIDWNRLGAKVGRNAEAWTLDGQSLNEVTFYAGIGDGQTLFKDKAKKTKPLPRFSAAMLVPEIVQLFESSYRVAAGTPLFSVDRVEPATFLGRQGFRFRYSFTVQDEEVRRTGEASGAVVDGKLYMIAFEAPSLHYFDRDVAAYQALVASAKLGAPAKK